MTSQPVSVSLSVFDSCYLEIEFQGFVKILSWDVSAAAFPWSFLSDFPCVPSRTAGSCAAANLTSFIWQTQKLSWLCPREFFEALAVII